LPTRYLGISEYDQFHVASFHRDRFGSASELRHERHDGQPTLGGVTRRKYRCARSADAQQLDIGQPTGQEGIEVARRVV
jgi:hypothetical protein